MANLQRFFEKMSEVKCVFYFLLVLMLTFFGFVSSVEAATYYWYGGTGNWSNYGSHWSTNSGNSPSSPAPNAPQAADNVIFDANSGAGTVTIDPASVTVASFDASTSSVAINDGGHTINVNGNILISTIASKLTSTGSWIQGASGSINNSAVTNKFYNLTMAGSGVTTTLAANLWVGNGQLTMGPGTLNGASYTIYYYGSNSNGLTVNNLLIGSSLGSFWFTTTNTINHKAITVPNNFVSVSFIFNLYPDPGKNLTALGDFNFGNNNVILMNSSFTGVPTNYLDMATSSLKANTVSLGTGNTSFYLKLGTSTGHSIGSLARIGTGASNAIDMGSSTLSVSGNVNFTGITVTPGISTLIMTGTSTLTSAAQTLNNLTYNSSGTLTLADNLNLNNNFNIISGSLISSPSVKLNGNGGLLTLNNQTLKNLQISGNTTLGGNLTVSGHLTIDSGKTLDTSASNYPISLAGNWLNSGTFTGNNSAVTFSSTSNQFINGSNNFYDFIAAASSANRTLKFASSSTQTISHLLDLTGSGGYLLSLHSDVDGQRWNITSNGSSTIDYVDVKDSNNTNAGSPITATNSSDSGNNLNWNIVPIPLTVSSQNATSINNTTATINGTIVSTGGENATERGFNLYNGTSCSGASIQNPKDTGGSYGAGTFAKTVTGLSALTGYSFIAYATNSSGTSTSSCKSFTTLGDIYYIVTGSNVWVRGSISEKKDIAQLYSFKTSDNQNLNYGNTYLISSTTPNTTGDYLAGSNFINEGDDAAPVNTYNVGYMMSDHGLVSPVVTSTGHDKTSADVGSIWSDGTYQFVLASVSGSNITFYSIPTGSPWVNQKSVLGTLTHVSGATHTGNITVTSQTMVQQYPVVKNMTHHVLADGATDVVGGGQGYANYLDVIEEFDLIDPSTMATTTNIPFTWNNASGIWMHVKNTFRATAGTTVVHSEYTVQRPMNLSYMGIIQVGQITNAAYDHQYYYIPKTKPLLGYDFRLPQIFDAAPTSTIIFNTSTVSNTANPPDRQTIFFKKNADSNYDLGFTFGYSPYGATAAANRSCLSFVDGCWWIYTTKKTYPVMVAATGEINNVSYDAYAYRQWVDQSLYNSGKTVYWNEQNGHDLVYIDYYTSATNDVTTLPSQFAGKGIQVLDSASTTVSENLVPENGQITVSTTGDSGYTVLELFDDISAPTNIGISSITADSATQLTVNANTATDADVGLHSLPYFFHESTGNSGGADSAWQASTSYVNSGLSPNTEYTYEVKARDANGNTSSYSTPVSKYTLASSPINFTATSSLKAVTLLVDELPNETAGQSGYYFSNPSGNSSGWIQVNTWSDNNLKCGQTYSYTVKYRNGDGVETGTASVSKATADCSNEMEVSGSYGNARQIVQRPIVQNIQTAQNNSKNIFVKTLKIYQTNPDVKLLQIFLNADPDTRIASTGAGSPGHETNYFGMLTRKAVIRFQEKYAKDILIPAGLTKGTGYVGANTLAKINLLLGGM